MLDVHMITPEHLADYGVPEAWAIQAMASVHYAINKAEFFIQCHFVDPVPGHIGRARAQGFAEGVEPYVTFVDIDDWVNDDAFAILEPALKAGHRYVQTQGLNIPWDGFKRGTPSRVTSEGLRVFRRADAMAFNFEPYPTCGTCALAASLGRIETINNVAYNRRIYQSSSVKQRAKLGITSCLG